MKRAYTAATAAALLLAACADSPQRILAPDEALLASGDGPGPTQVLRVPRDFATIQAAVDAARDGDVVQVRAGTYHENVVITTSNLRLHASAKTVLDGNGLGGFGIHVRGTPELPVTGVEISGFEVTNYTRGIILEWATHARVHRNEVHNIRMPPDGGLNDGRGILLWFADRNDLSQNFAGHNGRGGIMVAFGAENILRGNRVHGNGYQVADFEGTGITITGEGAHDNQIRENHVLRNYGRGIVVSRPAGTNPIMGNVIAQNRSHYNMRSGIAIMGSAKDNFVLQNDARWSNISRLAPCYDCNLMEMSAAGSNVWERNRGTLNLTDPCMP
jgi:parallel beta-helix repeat protein